LRRSWARPLGEHEDVTGTHRPGAFVEQQLAGARENELRLLGRVGVAPESLAGRHREVDDGRLVGARAAVGEELPHPLGVVGRARLQLEGVELVDVDRLHDRA